MKIIITSTFLIFSLYIPNIFSQDNTELFQFPHKTGDMWQYFYDDYSPMYVDTIQNFTISDSIDSKGIIHITQYGRTINPIRYPILFSDTSKYWVDTANNYVWGPKDQKDSLLIYKLNANKGEQWVIETVRDSEKIYGYLMARVLDRWKGLIFNKMTTFMNIEYYNSADSTDTTGYSVEGSDVIADGFGLISRGGGELAGEIHLTGAVINNILYGDTTLVSVKDYKRIVPLSFKLYQNYPNPFNPSTTISFKLFKHTKISLIIYNILGKEIYNLISDKDFNAGIYKVVWKGVTENSVKVSSGIYFYKLVADSYTETRKMIAIK